MFFMTGQTPHLHLQTTVFGEESLVIIPPSMSLHCESNFFVLKIFGYELYHKQLFCKKLILYFFPDWLLLCCSSNLSGLNLDGEISPSIGNLKDLVSM